MLESMFSHSNGEKEHSHCRKDILSTECVGGFVKEALEGYFLNGSEDSYESAWTTRNERYRQPFVVA